jgi:hypothetical protein
MLFPPSCSIIISITAGMAGGDFMHLQTTGIFMQAMSTQSVCHLHHIIIFIPGIFWMGMAGPAGGTLPSCIYLRAVFSLPAG